MQLDALILSLPARDSTFRMRVWRALKLAGCGVLRDGVYVLPASASSASALRRIEADIRAHGGVAMKVQLQLESEADRARLPALFDRGREYAALLAQIKD